MPFLLNEDQALKLKLQGITADSTNSPAAPVSVRFRLPEVELANVTFPLIVIEHHGINRAVEREARSGFTQLPYSPEGFDQLPDPTNPKSSTIFTDELPIPHNVDYIVRAFTRNARQMSVLTAALMQADRLHPRFAFLEIPQDGTVRRLDIIGGPTPQDGYDQDRKRLFQNYWVLRVSTELLSDKVYQFNNFVNQVYLDLDYYSDSYDLPIDRSNMMEA